MNLEQLNKDFGKITFNNKAWKNALPKGISRRKVSIALETSDSNLISIEKGQSCPSILLAFKYCHLTGLSPNDLMTLKP